MLTPARAVGCPVCYLRSWRDALLWWLGLAGRVAKVARRVLLRSERGVVGLLRLWQQQGDKSVYLQSMIPDPAVKQLGTVVPGTSHVAAGILQTPLGAPKLSVHASGRVHLKAGGEMPILFQIPALASLSHLVHLAEIQPASLGCYSPAAGQRETDLIFDVPFVEGSKFAVYLFVGPPLAAARTVGHVDIPMVQTQGPARGVFHYAEHCGFSFGFQFVQLTGHEHEEPDELERWVFNIQDHPDKYRATRIVTGSRAKVGLQTFALGKPHVTVRRKPDK